ncbi:MAG: hypothetical protein ACYTFQ_20395 [Planctomycetota bacterium]|jgi:hypothetical protein
MLYHALLAILIPWLSVCLLGGKKLRRYAFAVVPALLIFLGLAVREDINVSAVLWSLPFVVLISLYLRPTVLYINVRSGEVTNDTLAFRVPFSRIRIEIDRQDDNQLYSVHIEHTETQLRQLAWEASAQDEADGIAEDFRKWGIGAEAAQGQDNVIKADKRVRKLVMIGYIVAVMILLGVLTIWSSKLRGKSLEGLELQTALLIVKAIIGFLFLSILPFGLYLCRFGWRAIKHREMPPPGTTVIIDTKIIEGKKAVMRGRIIMALSIVLMALSLVGGLYFPYKLGRVFGTQIASGTVQSGSGDSERSE